MEDVTVSRVIYEKPQNVKIDNQTFNNVCYHDTRTFTDMDKRTRTLHNLRTQNSSYSVYLVNNSFDVSLKDYDRPVTKVIDGKTYKNIVSSKYYSNGAKEYERMTPSGFYKKIIVSPDGHVLNKSKSLGEIVSQGLIKLAKNLNIIL